MAILSGYGILATAGSSRCVTPFPYISCWLCASLLLVVNKFDVSVKTLSNNKTENYVGMAMFEEMQFREHFKINLDVTLALIKPDAIDKILEIEDALLRAGFVIIQKRKLKLTPEKASEFYEEHMSKPFFTGLISFMSSGPIVALIITKNDAVKGWRDLIGPTNSEMARETHPHCLRARFGTDGQRNAFHGSDSNSSALREIRFFFPNAMLEPKPLHGMEEYLGEAIRLTLIKGLTALCHNKPLDPVVWLADWLVNNNPNKPRIEEANE